MQEALGMMAVLMEVVEAVDLILAVNLKETAVMVPEGR
jgi:hypothetical protein